MWLNIQKQDISVFWSFLIFFLKRIPGKLIHVFLGTWETLLLFLLLKAHLGEEIWNKFLDVIGLYSL